MKKTDILQGLLDFFHDQGRVLNRKEYNSLPRSEVPVAGRMLKRYFRGRSYHQIIAMLRKQYPAEFASIGTKPVEEPVEEVVEDFVEEVVEEPVTSVQDQEDENSPLEALRLKTNG
tara:strand:+ start:659 stop:1006 length:348 start_codon:yes stop_codon:yes gene_type:complete